MNAQVTVLDQPPALDVTQTAVTTSVDPERIEELPAGPTDWTQPGLGYLERALFVDAPPEAPPLSGELRFFEGAGSRVTH